MKIAIACGGTGGHIYPAVAVAEEIALKTKGAKVLFLGDFKRLPDNFPSAFVVKKISSSPFTRKISLELLRVPFSLLKGFFEAYQALKEFSPQALFSTGGYSAIPSVLAARLLKIPIVLHEQNAIMGFANKFLRIFADDLLLSFEQDFSSKGTVVGNPVRKSIYNYGREDALKKFGFDNKKPIVLVMGGSQGAHSINQAVFDLVSSEELKNKVLFLHLVGQRDLSFAKKMTDARVFCKVSGQDLFSGSQYPNYLFFEYFKDMGLAYAVSDLVVGRAGATSIAEITSCQRPCILVPYPFAAEDHQQINAKMVQKKGLAVVVDNKQLSAAILADKITQVLDNMGQFKQAFNKTPDFLLGRSAASRITEILCKKS